MTFQRTLLLGALASCSLLAAGSSARADYTYTTTAANGGSVSVGTASAVNFQGTALQSGSTLTGVNNLNIQNIGITSTKPVDSPTDTGSFAFNFTIDLSQTNGPLISQPTGTGSTTVTGTFNVTRADQGGADSNVVFNAIAPVTIGGVTYTFSSPVYAPPTFNSGAGGSSSGNFSVTITPTATANPEPASVVMMGTGLVGLGGLTLIRRRRARRS